MIVSMEDAYTAWSGLPMPWQRAFEAAWASWRAGSAAVGAVITSGEGTVVAVGQNRMMDQPGGPGPLTGIPMAHAEMNALASLPTVVPDDNYQGYMLYTTYEPCFMCTATMASTYRISSVAFAACDPTWDGLLEALRRYPAIRERLPERDYLGGAYGALAYVLHVTGLLRHWPATYEAHERLVPARFALCRRLAKTGTVSELSQAGASIADVASALWSEISTP
jgi:tRNA(adenine34) deaminase